MTIHVRDAASPDAATLTLFMLRLAMETEHLHLDPTTVERGVKVVLADAAKGRYYVAEVDGEVVGCCMITHEWSDWRNGDMWWLQSVYVRADRRGVGVFRRIFEHVRRAARSAGVAELRLYHEQDNHAARQTYERLGMQETTYRVMRCRLAGEQTGPIPGDQPQTS